MKRRALNAFISGDFENAQTLFRRILAFQPDAPGVRHNLALTCIAGGDYDEAEKLLLTELERYGVYYPRLKVLADLYYIRGSRKSAHDFYRRALGQEAPEEERALLAKRIELTADDETFARVTEANRCFAEGNRFMADERWDEAVQVFTRAADLDETNIHALNNAGTIHLNNRNDPAEAIRLFREAMRWSSLPWLAKNLAKAEKAAGMDPSQKPV